MLLANLPPFLRLPLEIRIKLFSFAEQDDLKNLRLTDRTADHAIRNGRLCHFEEWLLSDDTSKFILNSRSKVQSVQIKDLLKPRRISANRGTALQNAREIILGKRIGSANLTKILQQVGNVRTLWMDEPGKKVLDGFVRSTVTFQYLTTLELFLGNAKYESDFLWALADEERQDFKFPSLKELNFSWIPGVDILVYRFHSWRSYFALHKLLWIHRATIISIDWNLNLWMDRPPETPADPKMVAETEAFGNLRAKLSEVTRLTHVKLSQINWESRPYWNLNSQLLEAQVELKYLSIESRVFNASEVRTLETIGIKNSSSLEKLKLGAYHPGWGIDACFNLPDLRSCKGLKDLLIEYFPYNPMTFVGKLPKGLTHLAITDGAIGSTDTTIQGVRLQPEHYEPVVQWIVHNLKELESISTRVWDPPDELLLAWSTMNVHHFKSFMNGLPRLERLCMKFFDTSFDDLTAVRNACVGKEGVVLEVETNVDRTCENWPFSFHYCKIDRSKFTPYPID